MSVTQQLVNNLANLNSNLPPGQLQPDDLQKLLSVVNSVANTQQIQQQQLQQKVKQGFSYGESMQGMGLSASGQSVHSQGSQQAQDNKVTKTCLENVIRFRDREYQFYGKGIISDEQAMEIFDKLINEKKDPAQSQRTLTQWKDDETHLFQYGLFAFMVKN